MRKFTEALHSLFLFGALGLVALGIYLNTICGAHIAQFPWLWFFGSLFIYNLDRLIPDPADAINQPSRAHFHRIRKWIIFSSLAVMLGIPISKNEWLLCALIVGASIFVSFYSSRAPILEKRIKDHPILKLLVPPGVILATLSIPAWWTPQGIHAILNHGTVFGSLLLVLMMNILLCDQGDKAGDAAAHLQTFANRLTENHFARLIWTLWILAMALQILHPRVGILLLNIYVAFLIFLARKPRPPWFYHWAVDGMLFLPLLGEWALGLVGPAHF